MFYNEIIEDLRRVVKEEGNCTQRVYDILKKSESLYLLEKFCAHTQEWSSLISLNRMVQFYRYSYCKELFEELHEIPYAVLKGAVMSKQIYGKPYYRVSGDIDLLVSPKNVDIVTQILKNNGFVQGKVRDNTIQKYTREEILYHKLYTHQLASFEKRTNFPLSPIINIDVNFDLLWGECHQHLDVDDVLRHIEHCVVFDIEVNRLSDIYEFIALCLHHYKDMNSIYLLEKNGLNINEFLDIYYYLINRIVEPDDLCKIAQRYNVQEYVYYCVFYTYELINDYRLKKYLEALYTTEANWLLECYGLCDSERRKWEIPFYERLFDVNFRERFRNNLCEEEQYKIDLNRKFM